MKSVANHFKALRREISQLKREIGRLRKAEAVRDKARARGEDVVIRSLKVVNDDGVLVAEISRKGILFCRRLWVSTSPAERGIFLNGDDRQVSAGGLDLTPKNSNVKTLDARGSQDAGYVTLRSVKTKQAVELRATGAALAVRNDKTGMTTVGLQGNSPKGGSLSLKDSSGFEQVRVEINHLSKAGRVILKDAGGKEWSGPLPGKPIPANRTSKRAR